MSPIHFLLSQLSTMIDMQTSVTFTAPPPVSVDVSATAVFLAKTNDFKQIFLFQSDANQFADLSNSNIKYYVDMTKWTPGFELNPANAMLDKITFGANGAIAKSLLTYPANRMYIKHDFLRYLSWKLFNNEDCVDLFQNEIELLDDIYSKCDGSAPNHSWYDISASLWRVSTTQSNLEGNAGQNFLTQSTKNPTNLSRELLTPIIAQASTRFDSIPFPHEIPQSIPFESGDSISFKFTISPAVGQELLTGVPKIPARTYAIKICLVDDIDYSNVCMFRIVISGNYTLPLCSNGSVVELINKTNQAVIVTSTSGKIYHPLYVSYGSLQFTILPKSTFTFTKMNDEWFA